MTDYYLQVTNLDFPGSGSPNLIEYQFEAIQNLDRLKEVGRTIAAAQNAEESVSYNFTPPKERVPLNWQVINGFRRSQLSIDKSRGTLVSSGIDDDRLKLSDVVAVDTTNEVVTVNGDVTGFVESGDPLGIRGSTGNDGTYTVSSTNYDSGNDETDITVNEDLTDSTADGRVFHSIRTIDQQLLWLRTYIFNGTNGTKYRFYGGNFSDWDGDGTDEGTPVSPENIRLPKSVTNLQNPQASIEMPIAEVI